MEGGHSSPPDETSKGAPAGPNRPGHVRRVALLLCGLGCWLILVGACDGGRRSAATGQGRIPEEPTRYTVTVGGVALQVEVAATPEEHRRGLSGRREVAPGTGMLFVYSEEELRSFWMKDTLVPLTVAFVNGEGGITQMDDMTPLSLASHESREPVRYALEVPQGWFEESGIEVGDRVVFSESLQRRLRRVSPGE